MAYQRPKGDVRLSKDEKVELVREYVDYYEGVVAANGVDALNVKIPRAAFESVLDEVGTVLNERSAALVDDPEVRAFLQANPLPPHMAELLPDEFRTFALLLNALKQWVVAESAATDRYLLGGTARDTCRAAVTTCIVTGEELGERAELHHPMRDGRPPILLSKAGHVLVEQRNQNGVKVTDVEDNGEWAKMCALKKERRMSWVQLREGCEALISGDKPSRAGAKSFANTVIRETGLTAHEVLGVLGERGVAK